MGRLWLALALIGCSPMDRASLVVDRVDPGSGTNDTVVPVRVEGTGFELPIVSDVDDGKNSVGPYSVTVGGLLLERAAWRDPNLIEGDVPLGLGIGPHDVVVTIGELSSTLPGGYLVVDLGQPVTCPPSYDVTIPSSTSSYRVIDTDGDFVTQRAACSADVPGATHLASLDTAAEIIELRDMLVARAIRTGNHYVGVAQQPNQATTTDGWFTFNGGALPMNMWSAGQPNDDLAGENNEENLAAINTNDRLNDATGDFAYPAVCECDGVPLDPTVATYLP